MARPRRSHDDRGRKLSAGSLRGPARLGTASLTWRRVLGTRWRGPGPHAKPRSLGFLAHQKRKCRVPLLYRIPRPLPALRPLPIEPRTVAWPMLNFQVAALSLGNRIVTISSQRVVKVGDYDVPTDLLHLTGCSEQIFESYGAAQFRRFREELNIRPGDTVLEIGCGVGRLAIPATHYL